jgi:tetratricopeptide (TPR) repeat protein
MSLLAIALGILPMSQSAVSDIQGAEQLRLNKCIELIDQDAEAAFEESLAWLGEGGRPAARYCNALAIIAMGNYKEGAARLEELANAPDAGALADRAIYLAQAGNAWLTAGYPEAALVTLDNAVKISGDDADVRIDRASANLMLERWDAAIEDLDFALEQKPNDVTALQLRSRTWLQLENFDNAEADLNRAMLIDGKNIETLVLRGDIREAKRLAGG